jgi:hypothetical protein
MPVDKHTDDDEADSARDGNAQSRFSDFDCPVCNANNPCDPALRAGDEPICHYCGSQFLVKVSDAGRIRLREL